MSALQGWLTAGAIAIVALFGWHYVSLSNKASRVPGLEQSIKDKDQAIADRDAKAELDAKRIVWLGAKLEAIDTARASADAEIAVIKTAISETAAATAGELIRAIPDNPICVYGADVSRLLSDQLDGLRPGHSR